MNNKAYNTIRSTVIANLGIDHTVIGDLLKLFFSKDTGADSLTNFFAKYDIESLEYPCVWMLSRLASKLRYAGVPQEQIPRLKGVVKKFTVENARSFCALPGVLEAFNYAGIAVMLLGGTAMKAFYEPTETRYYDNLEILVRGVDIKKACSLLEEQGFKYQRTFWDQRIYRKHDKIIAVHSTYLRANVLTGDRTDIWRYSREITWQGKKVLVPCPEMMLLILLVQGLEASCSRIQESQAVLFIKYYLDIHLFLKAYPLQWDSFVTLVEKSKFGLHVRLMLDILNQLYPETIAQEQLDTFGFTGTDLRNVERLISFNIAKKKTTETRNRNNVLEYYYYGIVALWNLNCYYGNRASLFSNLVDFPHCIATWNNHKGLKGLLPKFGGYKK